VSIYGHARTNIDDARLRIKRYDAISRLYPLADFLASHDETDSCSALREIANQLDASEEFVAVSRYLDFMRGGPPRFRDFYCETIAILPEEDANQFRTLFSSVSCAMANVRLYLWRGLDDPLMQIRRSP
jgi:hypothetical protein